MENLELEFRNEFTKATDGFKIGNTHIMMTPPIDKDYWVFRIKLYKEQALVAFPKFGTMGIGFAIEEDNWNTNLSYENTAQKIAKHIWCNRKYPIGFDKLCEAIMIISKAAKYYEEHEITPQIYSNEKNFVNYFEKMQEFVKANS